MRTLFDELFRDPVFEQDKQQIQFIKSSNDVYTTEFELAGFSRKDVKITATNELLKVEAKKGNNVKTFSVKLNELVSTSKIQSKMSNGLLTVTMPKKELESKEVFEIEIN